MMTKDEIRMYDLMVEFEIATEDELNLARNLVSGSWQTVLESVLYVRTGHNTMDSLLEEEW